jgi:hypothetical protein
MSPTLTTISHLSDEEAAGFIDGRLSPAVSAQVKAHLATCRKCRDVLGATARLLPAPGARSPVVRTVTGLAAAAIITIAIRSATLPVAGADLERTATDPTWTKPNSTLELPVLGTGFDSLSRATSAIDRVLETGQVHTDSSGSIASHGASAVTSPVAYDTKMTAMQGKKGIRTEGLKFAPKGTTDAGFDSAANFGWADQSWK